MKLLLLGSIALICSCSHKYQKHPLIDKREFVENNRATGSTRPQKMMSGRAEKEEFCAGQVLFTKNAQKITEASLPALVAQSCPGSDFLLDAKITRLWWTSLLYTRSCVTVESRCPKR